MTQKQQENTYPNEIQATQAKQPMGEFRKSVISGLFAFTITLLLILAVLYKIDSIKITMGVIGDVVITSLIIGMLVAAGQWKNHINDTRRLLLDIAERAWGIDLNNDGEIGARPVPKVEPIIGRIEVHNGGVTTVPYIIPVTVTQATEILAVLQRDDWKWSRARFVPRIMSQKPSDEMGKMNSELGLYEPNSQKLNKYGRALYSGLPLM